MAFGVARWIVSSPILRVPPSSPSSYAGSAVSSAYADALASRCHAFMTSLDIRVERTSPNGDFVKFGQTGDNSESFRRITECNLNF